MKRAIGYVRVSTDDQETSLEMQEKKIIDYCKLHNMNLVTIKIDDGVSAYTKLGRREGGKEILRWGKEKKIDCVVVWKLDRMFRNTVDALETLDTWDNKGISFNIIDHFGMSVDTKSSMGKLFITIMSGFAEFERNVISERTSSALKHKKSKLEKYTGNPPLGFVAEGKMLVESPAEMRVVRKVFAKWKSFKSYGKAADWLNENNIPTKNNGRWYRKTVEKIVNNDIYDRAA